MLRWLPAALVLFAAASAERPAAAQDDVGARPLEAGEADPDHLIFRSVVRFPGDSPRGSSAGGQSGSGFVVSEDKHIVTAWHVLANLAASETPYLRNTYRFEAFDATTGMPCYGRAELVGATEYRDIAVLQAVELSDCVRQLRPLDLLWDSDGELRGTVYTLGVPADDCSALPDCFRVYGHNIRETDERTGHILAETTVPVGMSGGPAMLRDGRVIGMNVQAGFSEGAELTRIAPVRHLRRAFWTFGIAPDESMSDYTADLADLLSKAERLTGILEEWKELEEQWERPAEMIRQMGERLERIDQEFHKLVWQDRAIVSADEDGRQSYVSMQFDEYVAGSHLPVSFRVHVRCRARDPQKVTMPDDVGPEESETLAAEARELFMPDIQIPFDQTEKSHPDGHVAVLPVASPLSKRSGTLNLGRTVLQIREDCANYYNSVFQSAKRTSELIPEFERFTYKDFIGVDIVVYSRHRPDGGGDDDGWEHTSQPILVEFERLS